jgi:hypothetical protein
MASNPQIHRMLPYVCRVWMPPIVIARCRPIASMSPTVASRAALKRSVGSGGAVSENGTALRAQGQAPAGALLMCLLYSPAPLTLSPQAKEDGGVGLQPRTNSAGTRFITFSKVELCPGTTVAKPRCA